MTTENQSPNPYAAVLADLRAKRAEIDNTIKILEGLSGLNLSASVGATLVAGHANTPLDEGAEPELIGEGAFHGMSIVDATKKLLALRKRKMGNPEIARELVAGGLVMNSADPVNTVGSVLTRRFNQAGDVVRVARGTWGLKEWYPGRTFKPSSKAPNANETTAPREEQASHEPDRPQHTTAIDDLIGNGSGQDDG